MNKARPIPSTALPRDQSCQRSHRTNVAHACESADLAYFTSDSDVQQLYTDAALVLDASTRVAAAAGSGLIDLHLLSTCYALASRRQPCMQTQRNTADATPATHAWSSTQHTRAHQRGRFLRPLLHAQARLARALRLTASVYRHVYSICILVYVYVHRAAHSATDRREARKVSFRRKTMHSTVDATHATHAWSTTQHARAHQRGRFLRPLLHAQTRLARALRLTPSNLLRLCMYIARICICT